MLGLQWLCFGGDGYCFGDSAKYENIWLESPGNIVIAYCSA